jgi:RNA polymerase sigma-70 factor (ECF subfamily)
MDDLTLIQQINLHDQSAMVMLHERYANLIYSIAWRVLNDDMIAEEATQDAFMKVWQNASQFDGQRGTVIAWLVGIARNVAIDKLRQGNRQVPVMENEITDSDNGEIFNLPDDWQAKERLEGLRFAVQSLPAEQSIVIELSYYGGMSSTEIADYLSLPLGTVKTRIRLGMQKLRTAWFQE